jgi:hypothetical protein
MDLVRCLVLMPLPRYRRRGKWMPLESSAETSESIQEERVRDCIGLHAAVKNWPEMTV